MYVVMPSHLYKADWNRPGISEQTRPKTQGRVSFPLQSLEGSDEWASTHPNQEGGVENVLYGPGERVGVNDKLIIWYWAGCW